MEKSTKQTADKLIVKGVFSIGYKEADGSVTPIYTNYNLLVNGGKNLYKELITGMSDASFNKIVIGTSGLESDNTTPKPIDVSRTQTFSEELTEYYYSLGWDIANRDGASGDISNIVEVDNGSTVNLDLTGYTAKYTVNIPNNAGNNAGTLFSYNEVGIYAGSSTAPSVMVACHTFPPVFKDLNRSLQMTWSFEF